MTELSPDPEAWARSWRGDGYVVVPGLFPAARVARLAAICEAVLARWRRSSPETGEPGGGPDATVMRHLNHPGYYDADGDLDAAARAELLRAIADPGVLAVGRAILADEPLFRCTSLFMNPLHTSQDGNWHRDSQFHHPDEADERRVVEAGDGLGHSVQLQVALVPSDDVEVVPGSHRRWDTPAEYAIRRADGQRHNRANDMPGALRVRLQAGDAVAFNPVGLHRGRYHAERPRRTLMLTYTATQHPRFDHFSDQPWFDDPGYLDGLDAGSRTFFDAFVEAYADSWRRRS